jgi:ATP-dependent DNA helicase DinG
VSPAATLLGPEGPLATSLPGYEARDGQLAMARGVEETLGSDGVLVCEAGTGTGKTLAYLVPAVQSGRKVVISTATRALQEQIFFKDIPLVERMLGVSAEAALMKGLSNYLCRRRYQEFRRSEEAIRPRHASSLRSLDAWIGDTEFGDRSELVGLGEEDPIWRYVLSSSETRIGGKCEYFSECFVTKMRRDAEAARIIVVNHHLFFADLALRGAHPGKVIPDYDAVIFDEAHQLEDIATDFFGVRVSTARVERVLRDAETALGSVGALDSLLSADRADAHVKAVRERTERLFAGLRAELSRGDGRVTLSRNAWRGALGQEWLELDGAIEGLGAAVSVSSARLVETDGERLRFIGGAESGALADRLDLVARRAQSLRDDLRSIVEPDSGNVVWLDQTDKSTTLSSSPVHVGHVFRDRIFRTVPAVVLTSATLSSRAASPRAARSSRVRSAKHHPPNKTKAKNGASSDDWIDERHYEAAGVDSDGTHSEGTVPAWESFGPEAETPEAEDTTLGNGAEPAGTEPRSVFSYLRGRLGLGEAEPPVSELCVPSPFDFAKNALLYTPNDLPDPGHAAFVGKAAERVRELVSLTDGGAFVLTTSIRSMVALHAALVAKLPGRAVLLQGQRPKSQLLAQFKVTGNAVLVATQSFWEGVDVPGRALRLVVLEKIPFPVPSDPIVQARSRAIEEQGGNAFMELHVPVARIALKQGFGRLIRSATDRGIVALFDARVLRKGYGKGLLDSLPPASRAEDFRDVERFWAQG